MKVKVLTLRWSDEAGGLDDRELDAFMEGHAVLEVAEHFFIHDKQPTLVLTLSYRDEAPEGGRARDGSGKRKTARPDPRQGLDPAERGRYDALRRWRNEMGKREGKPPYLYLTNRQAAELARRPPTSLADLREVRGIGESRVEAFGADLLALFEAMAGEGAVEPEEPAGQEAPADSRGRCASIPGGCAAGGAAWTGWSGGLTPAG